MRVACILFEPIPESHSHFFREVKREGTEEVEFSPSPPLTDHLTEFAQACLRFSPQIAIRKPNIIWIEIGKCQVLYSEQSFMARMQFLLRKFKYSAQIVIENDISSSLALALFKKKTVLDLPLEALNEFADPFYLDPLGRRSIEKMIEALKRLGIQTMSQLKELPAEQFPSRFGSLGLFCRQQIEQRTNRPWPQWSPPEVFCEKMELLPSEFCSDLEPLLFKAKELLDRLFSRLRGVYRCADRIQFSLELERDSTVKNPIRIWNFEMISPQSSTSGFLPILKERLNWDLQKNPIESYVIAMKAEVIASSVGRAAQRHFFHSREEWNETMGSFFGQMEEYLGKGQVFWADITEHRFPEKSWTKKRAPKIFLENKKNELLTHQTLNISGEHISSNHISSNHISSNHISSNHISSEHANSDLSFNLGLGCRYPQRPTRIFKTPIPVQVVRTRLPDKSSQIIIKGRSFPIDRWSSIERLSLDWIHQTPSRDYYRVYLKKGITLWLFMDSQDQYFLHGYYE